MVCTLALRPDASPADCAAALAAAWGGDFVFHLRGVEPSTDLRHHYGPMMELLGGPAHLAEDATIGDRNHQRTDGVWMEVRFDPAVPNAYRHSDQAQPLHTDGSYIPSFPDAGLLACVSQASAGGETIFLDGPTLVEILQRADPVLLARLEATAVPHARSGDRRVAPVIRRDGDAIILNWNNYCVDPSADQRVDDLRADFFSFLAREPGIHASVVPVRLAPGEAVIWKDDRVLHGRNGFKSERVSERFFWKAAFHVQPHSATGEIAPPSRSTATTR